MRIEDFIKGVSSIYGSSVGNTVDTFKLGIYTFRELQKEMGITSDENWIDFPTYSFSVELRAITTNFFEIEWGDGTPSFVCEFDNILNDTVTPHDAFSDWVKQSQRSPITHVNPQYPYNVTIPGNIHYSPPNSQHNGLHYPGVYIDDPFPSHYGNLVKRAACKHSWQKYQGLNHTDYTCSLCNERRDSIA